MKTTLRLGPACAAGLCLLLAAVSCQAGFSSPPVQLLEATSLGGGMWRYDYRVTNTDNSYPADYYSETRGGVIPFGNSELWRFAFYFEAGDLSWADAAKERFGPDFLGRGVLFSQGVMFDTGLRVGQSEDVSLIAPYAPGPISYEVAMAWPTVDDSAWGGGTVIGPSLQAVPEPSALALAGLGSLFGLAWCRRVKAAQPL